jgi:hypothetical protein
MVDKHADSLDAFMLDRNDGLQTDRGVSRPVGVAFHVPDLQHGRGRQPSGDRGQIRQGGVRPQGRAPNYLVVAAWVGFLVFIGAGAFVLAPPPEPIYYCATGAEFPAFEPCKEIKSTRDI